MRKIEALKCGASVIYTENSYGNYQTTDSYFKLITLIHGSQSPMFFEYIAHDKPVTPFFDIELRREDIELTEDLKVKGDTLVDSVIHVLKTHFMNNKVEVIHLQSHILISDALEKYSCHLIFRIYDQHGINIMLPNITSLKELVTRLFPHRSFVGIDFTVYRSGGGLFRTIYSSKPYQCRPLLPHSSNSISPIETLELLSFICYTPSEYNTFIPTSELPTPTWPASHLPQTGQN